jgi:hypothetical protein
VLGAAGSPGTAGLVAKRLGFAKALLGVGCAVASAPDSGFLLTVVLLSVVGLAAAGAESGCAFGAGAYFGSTIVCPGVNAFAGGVDWGLK